MTTILSGPVIRVRTAFLAHPGAIEAPDGSAIAPCPLCGVAGAVVMRADDCWKCSTGCDGYAVIVAMHESRMNSVTGREPNGK